MDEEGGQYEQGVDTRTQSKEGGNGFQEAIQWRGNVFEHPRTRTRE